MKVHGNICVGYTFSVFGCIYPTQLCHLLLRNTKMAPAKAKNQQPKRRTQGFKTVDNNVTSERLHLLRLVTFCDNTTLLALWVLYWLCEWQMVMQPPMQLILWEVFFPSHSHILSVIWIFWWGDAVGGRIVRHWVTQPVTLQSKIILRKHHLFLYT